MGLNHHETKPPFGKEDMFLWYLLVAESTEESQTFLMVFVKAVWRFQRTKQWGGKKDCLKG